MTAGVFAKTMDNQKQEGKGLKNSQAPVDDDDGCAGHGRRPLCCLESQRALIALMKRSCPERLVASREFPSCELGVATHAS